jgi:hypothetical protein
VARLSLLQQISESIKLSGAWERHTTRASSSGVKSEVAARYIIVTDCCKVIDLPILAVEGVPAAFA